MQAWKAVSLCSIGSHVAASVQKIAGWQADVLHPTHKLVMEVQDEMLEEMVPVSPLPFTALQAAVAGNRLRPRKTHTAPDGSGCHSSQREERLALQAACRCAHVVAHMSVARDRQAASRLLLQSHVSAKACS